MDDKNVVPLRKPVPWNERTWRSECWDFAKFAAACVGIVVGIIGVGLALVAAWELL